MQEESNPEQAGRYLDSKEASAKLAELGLKVAPSTLTKLRCVGGGPLFSSFGRRILYKEADILRWAEARTSRPRSSTSDEVENV